MNITKTSTHKYNIKKGEKKIFKQPFKKQQQQQQQGSIVLRKLICQTQYICAITANCISAHGAFPPLPPPAGRLWGPRHPALQPPAGFWTGRLRVCGDQSQGGAALLGPDPRDWRHHHILGESYGTQVHVSLPGESCDNSLSVFLPLWRRTRRVTADKHTNCEMFNPEHF